MLQVRIQNIQAAGSRIKNQASSINREKLLTDQTTILQILNKAHLPVNFRVLVQIY